MKYERYIGSELLISKNEATSQRKNTRNEEKN